MTEAEIAVIGAGPASCACAAALARHGRAVALPGADPAAATRG